MKTSDIFIDNLTIKGSDVPEVLNVHMNESGRKNISFRRIFFSSSEKLTFEKKNVIFFNTYLSFNLFYLIVVNFL